MESAAFSTLIEADVQVVADRTMTWDSTGYGSHAERGILTRTATTWYLAEGATHGAFNLFYLLQNPATHGGGRRDHAICCRRRAARSCRPIGAAQQPPHDPGGRRAGPRGDRRVGEHPLDQRRAVHRGARDVFQPAGQAFAAGHESAGVTAPATRWFLAEGATGSFFDMFILIANPSTQPASATCSTC